MPAILASCLHMAFDFLSIVGIGVRVSSSLVRASWRILAIQAELVEVVFLLWRRSQSTSSALIRRPRLADLPAGLLLLPLELDLPLSTDRSLLHPLSAACLAGLLPRGAPFP
jgi:hypothetical protein